MALRAVGLLRGGGRGYQIVEDDYTRSGDSYGSVDHNFHKSMLIGACGDPSLTRVCTLAPMTAPVEDPVINGRIEVPIEIHVSSRMPSCPAPGCGSKPKSKLQKP